MTKKLIENKRIIFIVLTILSIALLTSVIIPLFGYSFDNIVLNFVASVTALAAAVWILVMLLLKKALTINYLLFPTVFLFIGPLTINFNSIMDNNEYINHYSYVFDIVLYGLAILFFLIFMLNRTKGITYTLCILFIIILAFDLLSVFNGSPSSLARLIIGSIILINVHLDLKKTDNEFVQ